ncbi:hypothetical protein CP532_1432 [Ophiocordyceps camponoti-leonardi (nom. inval.)]|nr:hypothetical protein CP532_1432 [Ophiocordyceps camponoti-leonardi (nom. inval.)]
MRLLGCLVAAAAAGVLAKTLEEEGLLSRANDSGNAIVNALPLYPDCARPCYSTALADSPCLDTHCLCSDRDFRAEIRGCVKAACHIGDAMASKNVTEHACMRPRRDKTSQFTALVLSLGITAYVIVAARLIFKNFYGPRRRLGTDDWVILAAVVVGVASTVLKTRGLTRHGLGKDVWTLQAETVAQFKLDFYVLEILYIVMMTLAKAAINFFYLSIFPGQRTRLVLWVTAGVIVVLGLASVLVTIFQCRPVSYYWRMYLRTTVEHSGHCVDFHVAAWVYSGINIVLNLWLIVIPLSIIRKLELHWKKKIGVIVMFMTGTFDIVVSILRLRSLITFANSWNPTWDQFPVAWWSTIEIDVALICTSLPTIRLIFVRLFPRVFGTKQRSDETQTGPGSMATHDDKQPVAQPRTVMSLEIIEAHGEEEEEEEEGESHDEGHGRKGGDKSWQAKEESSVSVGLAL